MTAGHDDSARDETWLIELGFGALTPEDRASLLTAVQGELGDRVAHRLLEAASDEAREVLDTLDGEEQYQAWLAANVPEYSAIVNSVRTEFGEELRAGARVVCAELVPDAVEFRTVGLGFPEPIPVENRGRAALLLARTFRVCDRPTAVAVMRDAPGSVLNGIPEPAAWAVRHRLLVDAKVAVEIVTSTRPDTDGTAEPNYVIAELKVFGGTPIDPTDERPWDEQRFVFLEGSALDENRVAYSWEVLTRTKYDDLARLSVEEDSAENDVEPRDAGEIELAGLRGRVQVTSMEGYDWSQVILDVEDFPHRIILELVRAPMDTRQLIFRPLPPD